MDVCLLPKTPLLHVQHSPAIVYSGRIMPRFHHVPLYIIFIYFFNDFMRILHIPRGDLIKQPNNFFLLLNLWTNYSLMGSARSSFGSSLTAMATASRQRNSDHDLTAYYAIIWFISSCSFSCRDSHFTAFSVLYNTNV